MSVKYLGKPARHFVPEHLSFESWKNIEPYFVQLSERSIGNVEELSQWCRDLSELESVLSEELAWRYIKSTCDTANEELSQAYEFFITEIEPNAAPWVDKLNKKLDACPFREQIDSDVYAIWFKLVKNEISLFREANIPLFTEADTLSQEYGKIAGAQTVELDGKLCTLQQAANYLKYTDRARREEAFHKIWERRIEDKTKLDDLFDQLIAIRQKIAGNCGFDNYRDYMFAAMARFDYTKQDCFDFHLAIEKEVMPVMHSIDEKRRQALKLEPLRPWDMDVDVTGKPPVKPFKDGRELIDKTVKCLEVIHPDFAEYIRIMDQMKHFDLDSRIGKAPGGYNYPLAETGVPFIFMNSAGSLRDLVTMVHEAGHAVHSFLMNPLPVKPVKDPPSEVCELASMAMELITMEHWDVFISDKEELRRAKKEQLEKVIGTLPWVAAVDAFQHWVYENKNHTPEMRDAAWVKIISRFDSGVADWKGFEHIRNTSWQKQLHIFEVPFYYIEYGIAQLGAIAVWRNYKNNPEQALRQYSQALQLGYTRPIGEIYKAAGVKFDFSVGYVKELMEFVQTELNKLD
ncbi:MAG: M3 family oligoendopeptidase [Bacteroidia bacterium]